MRVSELPLGEVPYLAIDRLLSKSEHHPLTGFRVKLFDSEFLPSDMANDLKTGRPTPLVYWYPRYIDDLYDIALCGENPMDLLEGLHPKNVYYFHILFTEVWKKLDKLTGNSIELNHLDETVIKKGRVKL